MSECWNLGKANIYLKLESWEWGIYIVVVRHIRSTCVTQASLSLDNCEDKVKSRTQGTKLVYKNGTISGHKIAFAELIEVGVAEG